MRASCLFCDNRAGNREHLWPKWIHERVDVGPVKMGRYGHAEVIIQNPEITVKSVCGKCNNGWMHDLETANIPIIGSMLNDLSVTLDRDQQARVTAWCVKTAMVLDSSRPKDAGARFYLKQDCVAMRESLTTPPKTRAWIGRIATKHLVALGTTTRYSRGDMLNPHTLSSVATFVAGHFVAQVITQRQFPRFAHADIPDTQPKGDDWEINLTQICPIQRDWITWPPHDSFTNGGPNGIAYLMDRWRIGERVDPSTIPPGLIW